MSLKRVLIITYYWPPTGGSGVQRWVKFAKYLREFGWEPVIYTPENPEAPALDHTLENDLPDNLEVIKTHIVEPYSLYKKFTGQDKNSRIGAAFLSEKKKPKLAEKISLWIRGNLFIPDPRVLWVKPSVRFLTRYLNENPVDAIATTGPPHSMHLIGLRLKQHLGIPWLADFRDPWTEIEFYDEFMPSQWADKKHHRLESDVVKQANMVTTVGKSMANSYESMYGREVQIVTNGYDEDDFSEDAIPLDEKFSISYVGTLARSQNPLTLWKVLSDMIKEEPDLKEDLKIQLIGKTDLAIKEALEMNGLMPYLDEIGYIPHDQVADYQRKAQILLIISKNVSISGYFLPAKFFEYMAAQRPILCIGPPEGDIGEVLTECNAGYIADFGDYEATKRILTNFYQLYKKGRMIVNSKGIEKYSRRNLTEKLSKIMNSMLVEQVH